MNIVGTKKNKKDQLESSLFKAISVYKHTRTSRILHSSSSACSTYVRIRGERWWWWWMVAKILAKFSYSIPLLPPSSPNTQPTTTTRSLQTAGQSKHAQGSIKSPTSPRNQALESRVKLDACNSIFHPETRIIKSIYMHPNGNICFGVYPPKPVFIVNQGHIFTTKRQRKTREHKTVIRTRKMNYSILFFTGKTCEPSTRIEWKLTKPPSPPPSTLLLALQLDKSSIEKQQKDELFWLLLLEEKEANFCFLFFPILCIWFNKQTGKRGRGNERVDLIKSTCFPLCTFTRNGCSITKHQQNNQKEASKSSAGNADVHHTRDASN